MTQQPCKCGRRWIARWYGKNAGYTPVCPGCGETPGKCTCAPLKKPVCGKYNINAGDVDPKMCSDNCNACGYLKTFT